jgi:hypothetical protein
LVIDTSGEPACTVSSGALVARFKLGAGSVYLAGGYAVTVTGTPGGDTPATAPIFTVVPQIVLSPNNGPAGVLVSIAGSGFDPTGAPGCAVSSTNPVGLDAAPGMVCVLSGVDGTVSGSFTVDVAPAAPNGNYTVTIAGTAAGVDEASALFSKTASLALFPASGRAGTSVVIQGSGFNAGDVGCVIIAYPSNLISNPVCTIALGTVQGSFTVATGASGAYTVKVIGTTGDFGLAAFTVPTAPTLVLNPFSGEVGTTVTAKGSYYQGTICTLSAGPGPALFASQACSIAAGNLTGSFVVASTAAPGTVYTITAQTNAGAGDSGTATFAVTAGPTTTLALTPTLGPVGTVVSGKATGFPTDAICVLASAPYGLFFSSSCTVAGGNVTVGFTVSSGATAGSYTIVVLGNTGRSASATFIVAATPLFSISVNPSSLVLSPGGTGTAIVTVLSTGGFNSPVTLVASLPAGVTGGFSPNPVTPPAGSTITSTLSIGASSGVASSTTAITITGTSGGLTATASFTLVIQVIVTTTTQPTTTATLSTATETSPWTPPKCVIATATFGSEASPAVQFLRNFRDRLVLSTTAGSAFMQVFNAWYYSFSPSVAEFIASNDPIRAPIRVFLYPLLGVLGISTFAYSLFSATPEFAIVMAGLVASSLIGLVYLTLPVLVGMRSLLKRRSIAGISIARISMASLAMALLLIAVGEFAQSFVLLAVGSSALVLTCIIVVPTLAARVILRTNTK